MRFLYLMVSYLVIIWAAIFIVLADGAMILKSISGENLNHQTPFGNGCSSKIERRSLRRMFNKKKYLSPSKKFSHFRHIFNNQPQMQNHYQQYQNQQFPQKHWHWKTSQQYGYGQEHQIITTARPILTTTELNVFRLKSIQIANKEQYSRSKTSTTTTLPTTIPTLKPLRELIYEIDIR